jgi:prepilin-type N-terminal cleavage/methylation domain-containing protein
MAHGSKARAGFTLLELIVVMTLLAIISAAVVPVFGGTLQRLQLRSAQDNFVSTLAFAQDMAVRNSREYRLYVDPEEGSYWAMYVIEENLEDKVFEFVTERWGQTQYFPEYLEMRRPRLNKDRELDAYYIACYPNGACDRAKIRLDDTRDRRRHFEVETLGSMGQFEVTNL